MTRAALCPAGRMSSPDAGTKTSKLRREPHQSVASALHFNFNLKTTVASSRWCTRCVPAWTTAAPRFLTVHSNISRSVW